jgi:raffinose/stachyose/melibiose transport system permease protein
MRGETAMARHGVMLSVELRRARIARTLLSIALTLIAAALIYPIFWMILFSFKDNPEIFRGNFFPSKLRWENYSKAWNYAKLGRAFANSVFITVLTIALSLSLSLMVSYAVTRLEWKWRRSVYVFCLLGLYIPIHAALLPLMLVMKTVKLLGTYWAIVLPYTAFNMSFCIMVFSGFLETIPRDLEEAAAIDGSPIFRTFLTIITPLLAPAISVLTIFVFMSAYNEFLMALVLITKASMKTVNLSVSGLFGQYNTNLGVVGAALTLTIVPIVIVYIAMSRQVQEGLTGAAIKG